LSHLPLGVPNWSVNTAPSTSFLAPLPGRKRISARGVSHLKSFYFVIVLLSLFTLSCLHLFIKNTKKLVPSIVGTLLLYVYFIMLIPEYVMKNLAVGSGSIIGKDNIEKFFNHVSKHKDIEDRSLASYEIATAYLVHMLEARFVNLNPIMQQMFLKLHGIEDTEKRNLCWKLCVKNLEMLL
jgi:hypothetical protein